MPTLYDDHGVSSERNLDRAFDVTFSPKGRAVSVRTNMRLSEMGSSGRCATRIMYGANLPAFNGKAQTRTIGVALKSRP